jgi:hypothetical protein
VKMKGTHVTIAAAVFCALAVIPAGAQSSDPLPSWNEGKSKKSIVDFVAKVTKTGSSDFVPPAERIATRQRGQAQVRNARRQARVLQGTRPRLL